MPNITTNHAITYTNLFLFNAVVAPLAPMIIPGKQNANFTFNIFIVVIYF